MADHEAAWSQAGELRAELERLRGLLLDCARVLAQVCEAPALIEATDELLGALQAEPGAPE